MTPSVLVVDATGILAPAVASLVAAGRPVLAVARTSADLDALVQRYGARVRPLAADARDASFPSRVADAVDGQPLAGALVYGPTTTESVLTAVAGLSAGPVVHVQTSAAARPGVRPADPPPGVRRLLLGWRPNGAWHTAEEVSLAALALLDEDSAANRVLGVVRPWSERPA